MGARPAAPRLPRPIPPDLPAGQAAGVGVEQIRSAVEPVDILEGVRQASDLPLPAAFRFAGANARPEREKLGKGSLWLRDVDGELDTLRVRSVEREAVPSRGALHAELVENAPVSSRRRGSGERRRRRRGRALARVRSGDRAVLVDGPDVTAPEELVERPGALALGLALDLPDDARLEGGTSTRRRTPSGVGKLGGPIWAIMKAIAGFIRVSSQTRQSSGPKPAVKSITSSSVPVRRIPLLFPLPKTSGLPCSR